MTIINNTLRISLRRPIRSIRKSDLSTINSLAKTFIRHQTNESTAKQIVSEPPRVNQVGIQYLSESLHKKVFPNHPSDSYLKPEYPELLKIAEKHLKHNDLLNRKTQITEPINIENFPDLVGNKTLDEHFYKIGKWSAEPYLSMAEKFFKTDAKLPKRPQNWQFEAGWYRYVEGKEPESVPFPLEDELVFDVEVLYKKSPYAVLATCVSQEAWYGWVSPFLTNYAEDPTFSDWEHLIPFNCLKKPKLLVGYNVSYDRSRVADEYNIKQSQAFYLDGMALHVAISGICSQQRPKWQQHKKSKNQLEFQEEHSEEISSSELAAEYASFGESISQEVASDLVDDPWLNKGAPNSLANVLDFHCKIKLDKSDRDFFSSENPMDVIMNFNKLMDYCATDVEATYTVTKKLLPEFREKVPHPVSFAALRHLGTLILPTTKKWENYIETAEKIYTENRGQVTENLKKRANELIKYIEQKNESLEPNHQEDPWLRQLNWTIKKPRLKKDGSPSAKQAYLTGYPEWYRELFKTATVNGVKQREMNLTVRTRITPLLLRLKWEGYPLVWTESQGWCFKVPYDEDVYQQLNEKNYSQAKLSAEDMELLISELRDDGRSFELFKVPHPDGPNKRCTLIMSKSYLRYFEDGTMTSEYNYAQEILSLNSAASYWMGNRTRITEQFVVYNDTEGKKNKFFDTKRDCKDSPEMGIILPKLCTMGTITRRATENTWLTASNAKRNRIGSELKSLIEAPKGYCFVGADVDSEELWIASLVGDSMFRIHGGTALGWMTLEGDKTEKTDLHSKTAEILGISRNDAKVFNYGRIYGAGVKFATRLLKQFNSKLSDDEAERIAKKLYASTKGEVSSSKALSRRLYHGGTESVMFNALESIAYQKDPRTPVLGAAITAALTIENLNKNNYLTSRINWAIQSSGVDYLHLLVVSMEYLIDKYQIDARLAVTVHDELRYLVREDDKYKAALLLQISNLWTRAMFCEQLGITEVPQSCAFFSEVDIDHVLRKEVHMDCITPSNPIAIPPGESLSIGQLLDKCENGKILIEGTSPKKLKLTNYKYPKRNPVILKLDQELDPKTKIASVRLQNSIDKDEWKKNINIYIKSKKDADFDDAQKEFYVKKPNTKPTYSKPQIPLSTRTKRRSMEEFDVRVEGIDGNALLKNDVMQSPIKKPRKEVTKVAKPKVYEKRIEKSPITNGMTPTKMVSTKKVKSAIKYTPYSAQTVKSSGKPARSTSCEGGKEGGKVFGKSSKKRAVESLGSNSLPVGVISTGDSVEMTGESHTEFSKSAAGRLKVGASLTRNLSEGEQGIATGTLRRSASPTSRLIRRLGSSQRTIGIVRHPTSSKGGLRQNQTSRPISKQLPTESKLMYPELDRRREELKPSSTSTTTTNTSIIATTPPTPPTSTSATTASNSNM